MKAIEEIKNWVSIRVSFYFFLPDGPYGRPFDNQYKIESVALTSRGIEIKFHGDFFLYFTGEPEVIDEGCNLLIKKYHLCDFKSPMGLSKTYDYGEVMLCGF